MTDPTWIDAYVKETSAYAASLQIGRHLSAIAELVGCIRADSDGGELVLQRTTVDLQWLARKITGGDYIAHVPNHLHDQASAALRVVCGQLTTESTQ